MAYFTQLKFINLCRLWYLHGGGGGNRSFVSLCSLQSRRLLQLSLQSVFSIPVKYALMAYFTQLKFINLCRLWYLHGGGGGNRTRVRRHCHLNIYKLVPYFKSHFLCSYGHDQKSQPALNFLQYYCRQITLEYPANRRLSKSTGNFSQT